MSASEDRIASEIAVLAARVARLEAAEKGASAYNPGLFLPAQYADLEEGDTSDFDVVTTSGSGTFVASAAAALRGSWGAAATLAAASDEALGRLDGPSDEGFIAAGMLFDPNSLTMADGDNFVIMVLSMDAAVGGTNWCDTVYLRRSSGQYLVRGGYVDDAGTATYFNYITVDDGPHSLQVIHKAASGVGANDGEVRFYVDGILAGRATGIDNDQRLPDRVSFGAANGVDAGTSGTFYVDDCWWG